MSFDYEKEQEGLGGDYWKPKAGNKYNVKALSELIPTESYKEKDKDDNITKETEQVELIVKVGEDNKHKKWTISKGTTKASLYGQLIELAIENKNELTGKEFMLVVKDKDGRNDYTIF